MDIKRIFRVIFEPGGIYVLHCNIKKKFDWLQDLRQQ
jgi:hypothetical protein